MIIRQVALLSESAKVSQQELLRVSAALQRQVTRDFAPIWNVLATVDPFDSADQVPPGYWPITVLDKIPVKGAGGFHLDEHGQPYADVLWSPNWSLTASHECLEMLADPFGHQLASGASVKPGQGRVTYLVEVCDPCEAAQFAYTMNTGLAGEETLVSDFYTPAYFDPVAASGVRYSFHGSITRPKQVLRGGYLSWRNPTDGHIWQLFGPAEMGDFRDQGPGTLNREFSDGLVRVVRRDWGKAKPKPKAAGIAKGKSSAALLGAAVANDCNLVLNSSGNLTGPTGAETTIVISDDAGTATFSRVSYDGTVIAKDVTSATFTIKAGRTDLSFVYSATEPGVTITIKDPCGNSLDSFKNDLGNPIEALVVEGV